MSSIHLTAAQWAFIPPLRPPPARTGRPRADDRRIIEGLLYGLITGCRGQDLPDDHGAPTTVWRHLRRWGEEGVWERIWRAAIAALDGCSKLEWSMACLNGSFAPAKKGEAAQTRGGAGNGFRRRPAAWSAERQKGTRDVSIYEIRVQGRLDAHWAAWFEGLTLAYDGDTTMLRGSLVDEAALHGVLTKIAGLNLHLLSVNAVETDVTASATLVTPATPNMSPTLGREPEPLDAPPSEPLADIPVPAQKARKRKAGLPRKRNRRQKRSPP